MTPTKAQQRAEFNRRLRSSMAQQRMTLTDAAERLGVNRQALGRWLRGTTPLAIYAQAIGEVFNADMATMLLACWSSPCGICGKVTVSTSRGGTPKQWCGPKCKDAAMFRRRRASTTITVAITRNRLTEHQEAVLAMCTDCTLGVGLCDQWECPLRSVSPIPLSIAARREQQRAAGAVA